MHIASSSLDLAAQYARQVSSQNETSLRFLSNNATPAPSAPSTVVSLSADGQAAQSAQALDHDMDQAVDRDPRMNLLRRMMEALTGEKIRVFDIAEFQATASTTRASSAELSASQTSGSGGNALAYDYHSSYSETQAMQFSASGTVTTKDGQTFSFKLDLSMSYSYQEQRDVSVRVGNAPRQTDPLVLNFEGTGAQLQDMRFAFDLNGDGQQENINPLAAGSAFLVFDRNHDNQANDGRELFGPTSGNGFSELARLDDDKNGWIDENDRAFGDLKLWQPDRNGNGALQSLADRGVGALSLAAVDSPFSLKNLHNDLLGQLRSTGIFLSEEGKPGALQQVDLTV